ncbi:MAG: hypothetical protein K0R54_1853 [Clostridiaceae bacterium]|jgi:hypothetical protein|nr:hypothetical protein [Clostridiaceae bacterium]
MFVRYIKCDRLTMKYLPFKYNNIIAIRRTTDGYAIFYLKNEISKYKKVRK